MNLWFNCTFRSACMTCSTDMGSHTYSKKHGFYKLHPVARLTFAWVRHMVMRWDSVHNNFIWSFGWIASFSGLSTVKFMIVIKNWTVYKSLGRRLSTYLCCRYHLTIVTWVESSVCVSSWLVSCTSWFVFCVLYSSSCASCDTASDRKCNNMRLHCCQYFIGIAQHHRIMAVKVWACSRRFVY